MNSNKKVSNMLKGRLKQLMRKNMKKILLVDDEPTNLTVLELLLNKFGYIVVLKSNAESALFLFREGVNVDLVITDYRMPGMNGVEFVKELRRILPSVPVLMLTGDITVEIEPSLGVFELINKPVAGKELERIVKAALDRTTANSFYYCMSRENLRQEFNSEFQRLK
jgi:CheY-like chemotaxis protein